MKHYKFLIILLAFFSLNCSFSKNNPVQSIETGYTINLVRTAENKGKTFLVASSYEGTLVAYSYEGKKLWEHKLSGFMNHDVWCGDLDGDEKDEVLVANADGSVYCLDSTGKLLWRFSKNEAPFKSITITYKDNVAYAVAGSYDTHMYYLDKEGKLVLDIPSNSFSIDKAKSKNTGKTVQAIVTNFIRPAKYTDGSNILVIHGMAATNSNGSFYYFKPLEDKPFYKAKNETGRLGDLRVVDVNKDGVSEILVGKTGEANKGSGFYKLDFDVKKAQEFSITKLYRKLDAFGYRVTQPELIKD